MKAELTTTDIRNARKQFIVLTVGDIAGVPMGKQWYLKNVYKNYAFVYDDYIGYWSTYSIRNGTTGEIAYSNKELATKLNKSMDSYDKKKIGYLLELDDCTVKNHHDVFFSNVHLVNGILKTGERVKFKENPVLLPTPTF